MAIPSSNTPAAVTTAPSRSYTSALIVVTSLFFMWGFVTVLNDILVPHLKSIFDLNYTKASLIQFAFFTAYFIFSIPSAKLIDWVGYKKTMVIGIATMGAGALLFIPAASIVSYPLFLGALMVLAGGITALQVAANPYVAVLGSSETASSRLNLSQAFNSLGTTIGPWIGGAWILSAAAKSIETVRQMPPEALHAYRVHEASSVKIPYLAIGLALVVIGILISAFRLPAIPEAQHHKGDRVAGKGIWSYRNLVLGAVGIFVYVGAEVSIGSYLINYFSQASIGNISEMEAAKFVSFYWGGAMIGRFIGSAVLHGVKTAYLAISAAVAAALLGISHVGIEASSARSWIMSLVSDTLLTLARARPLIILCLVVLILLFLSSIIRKRPVAIKTGILLGGAALMAAVLVTISILTNGHLAMWSIILVGFFNSIMFPSIFTLGIAELGPLTGDGSGLLIMAIVGGALIPLGQGWLADQMGLHHAFFLPAICYLYIMYYGFSGSKTNSERQAKA